MYLAPEEIPLAHLTYSLFHSLPLLLPIASLSFFLGHVFPFRRPDDNADPVSHLPR